MGEDSIGEGSSQPENPRARGRRWPFVLTIVVLSMLAAGMGTGFAYSNSSAQAWRESSTQAASDLASTRQGLASVTQERDQLLGVRDELTRNQSSLADMTSKYNAASDRIRSLSNEKAQVGDQAALMAGFVATSHQVTQEMDQCISALQTLEGYLVNARSYDSVSLGNYTQGINKGCNQARADSDALSKKLAG